MTTTTDVAEFVANAHYYAEGLAVQLRAITFAALTDADRREVDTLTETLADLSDLLAEVEAVR